MTKTTPYREQQRMNQWWFVLLMLLLAAFLVHTLITYWPHRGVNWGGDIVFFISIGLGFAVCFFPLIASLDTYIDEEGVSVRYRPFLLKPRFWSWDSIESCSVETYKPIAEFGGWGIKSSYKKAVYSTKGNRALILRLDNGRRVYIGTQYADELSEWLTAFEKNKQKRNNR